jgi:NAD(P)-dependent dehydrogenase (short-subunit alcohol dehydrogenase family)
MYEITKTVTGTTAIITGAGRGFGCGIAAALSTTDHPDQRACADPPPAFTVALD